MPPLAGKHPGNDTRMRTHVVHDDGAIDGELQVAERRADDADDALHAVDLLTQEDVQRLQLTHLLQAVFHLSHGGGGGHENSALSVMRQRRT